MKLKQKKLTILFRTENQKIFTKKSIVLFLRLKLFKCNWSRGSDFEYCRWQISILRLLIDFNKTWFKNKFQKFVCECEQEYLEINEYRIYLIIRLFIYKYQTR